MTVKTAAATVAVTLLAFAEHLVFLAVALPVLFLAMGSGVDSAGAFFLALILGAFAALLMVRTLPGRSRPIAHACREMADRVADWAGWAGPPNP